MLTVNQYSFHHDFMWDKAWVIKLNQHSIKHGWHYWYLGRLGILCCFGTSISVIDVDEYSN